MLHIGQSRLCLTDAFLSHSQSLLCTLGHCKTLVFAPSTCLRWMYIRVPHATSLPTTWPWRMCMMYRVVITCLLYTATANMVPTHCSSPLGSRSCRDSIIYSATCEKLKNQQVAIKMYIKAKLSPSKLRAIKREAAMMIYMTRKRCSSTLTALQQHNNLHFSTLPVLVIHLAICDPICNGQRQPQHSVGKFHCAGSSHHSLLLTVTGRNSVSNIKGIIGSLRMHADFAAC